MSPLAPALLDPERFLVPVSDSDPSGPSLRYEGTHDRIREARRSDDPSLPQGIWERELKKAEWPRVAELCTRALETRSKDLVVAAWLLEAWLHLHGAAGVRAGVETLHLLAESFWSDLHPRLGEDGSAEARAAPFQWINEKLTPALRELPVTRPDAPEAAAYAWGDWQDLLRAESRKGGSAEEDGALARARFEESVARTPPAFYREMVADLRASSSALGELRELLDRRCGAEAPSLARFTEGVAAVRSWAEATLARVAPEPDPEPGPAPRPAEEVEMPTENPGAPAAPRTGALASREEAYRSLEEAADYLLRTEPHSPVPYLVKRAVAWGGLTLADLLHEFVRDGHDLNALRTLLGLAENGQAR